MFGTAWATDAGAAGAQMSGMEAFTPFIPLILIFAVFYFLIIRPQSKRQKAHQEYLSNLKRGDKVITNSGVYGQIDRLDGNTLILEVGEEQKIKIKVTRGAIAGGVNELEKQPAPTKTGA